MQINGKAQNLVTNGSFEDYYLCPDTHSQFEGYVKNWRTFFGTPNYLNLCGYSPVFDYLGIAPRTGNGYTSVFWYSEIGPDLPREYIHGELTESLKEGEIYYFEFYSHIYRHDIATNQHSVHFSRDWISEVPTNINSINEFYLDLEPHIDNQDSIYTEQKWIKTSGCYVASGDEKYFVLGNFRANTNAQVIYTGPNRSKEYILIDDVSMFPINQVVPNDTVVISNTHIELPKFLGQRYFLNDIEILEDNLKIEDYGTYQIDVYLGDCGFIESFSVEVISCFDEDNYYLIDNELIENYSIYSEFCDIEMQIIEGNNCFYIPNAFSPNDDGINDNFGLLGSCNIFEYKLIIFDRWGNLVFKTTKPSDYWDGKYRGVTMSVGIYVYFMDVVYISENNLPYKFKSIGNITLIE